MRDRFYGNARILENQGFSKNRKKTDVNYLMMETTKITDRLDILESESNDENEETKGVGAVHIEFNGKLFSEYKTTTESIKMTFSGFSDLIQSQRYGDGGPSNDNSDQVIKQKLTKEGFNAIAKNFSSI